MEWNRWKYHSYCAPSVLLTKMKTSKSYCTLFFKRNATFLDPFFPGDPGSLTLQISSIYTLPKKKRNFPCCISFEGECRVSQYSFKQDIHSIEHHCLTHRADSTVLNTAMWSNKGFDILDKGQIMRIWFNGQKCQLFCFKAGIMQAGFMSSLMTWFWYLYCLTFS